MGLMRKVMTEELLNGCLMYVTLVADVPLSWLQKIQVI